MKTAISIPDSLFLAADRAAKRLGISRSELYQKALATYLEAQDDSALTVQLNRVYTEGDPGSVDRVLARLQGASLGSDEW
jgi:predicted NACHT family NTPase